MAITTVPTPADAKCTITTATTGTCDAPAVTSFKDSTGRTFHECADHAIVTAPAEPDTITVGATVKVTHIGVEKTGTVEKVGRTIATVRVPIGRKGATKTIRVPIAAFGR